MKRFLFLATSIIFGVIFLAYYLRPESKETDQAIRSVEKTYPLPPAEVERMRTPAMADSESVSGRQVHLKNTEGKVRKAEKADAPLSVNGTYLQGLPDDLTLVSNIFAVSESEFNPIMGEVVRRHQGLVFFRTAQSIQEDNWANVVHDRANNRFYPLSSVLKVNGAGEALRANLLSSGSEEHYYHHDLQILYLQSSHTRLLTLYQELISQGFNAELEILRGVHGRR